MTRQCPDHPRTVGATSTDCHECRRESVPPPPAFLAAKAAIQRRQTTHTHTDAKEARS